MKTFAFNGRIRKSMPVNSLLLRLSFAYNKSVKPVLLTYFLRFTFFLAILSIPVRGFSQVSASWNYGTETGILGTTYSWIDCSSGTTAVSGDDAQASVNWPFNFTFYDNNYTTANSLSVATNGFIRLDGIAAGNNYTAASSYDLTASGTSLGQIIAMAVYDDYVGRLSTSWCKYLVTGTAPYRIFTIEYNNLEIDYNDGLYADVEVSFYETTNEIVLKLGDQNISASGVDMGIHSGVNGFYNKWQEVQSGTNNTWIKYMLPVEVIATNGTLHSYYPSLKAAFDRINNGSHQGNITIKIHGSTAESASAVLNANGTGSANYASVNVYPATTGLSISGSLSSPLIDLNGADNVTIDGRVNATGTTPDMTIINTSTASVAGTSTIRLINNARNNSVKYCNIEGSETVASSGVVFFSTAAATSGNNNNTIDNNNITNAANTNRPVNAIFSSGTLSRENTGNIISNNNIYDFLKNGTASNGIFLSSNTTTWNITGNSFYETTTFVPSGTVTYNAIQINNTSGNGFTVSDNYIGGSTALCAGTAWTKTNNNNNVFNAVYLNVGSAITSSIQNNIIKNFDWSNSGNAAWTGINVLAGDANIGTDNGNYVGESTGTGSITVTGRTSGQNVYGIYIASTGVVICQNNEIGSITADNTNGSRASNIYGIYRSPVAGTTTISNNTIGSTSASNSIYAVSTSTGNAQIVIGISSDGTGTIIISGNTIANLTNAVTGTSVSQTMGIETSAGSNTIQNNTVYNISTASGQTGTTTSASAMGIIQKSTTAGTIQTVVGNTIYNISNTNTTARVDVYGIYYFGPDAGANTVMGNFVHSLSLSSSNILSAIDGIYLTNGLTTIANNIINLGTAITTGYLINGIWDNGGTTNNNSIYFNSVYIGGTVTGTTSSTSALWNAANTSTRNYRNNILVNARSGGSTGEHYAIRLAGTTGLTIDYNDYYVSGTRGVLGYLSSDRTTLALWQTATGQDVNSLNLNPLFASAGGTLALNYYSYAVLAGVSGTGITTDYSGLTRNIVPKMGAFEVNIFVWTGSISTDFGTAGNWTEGAVPPNGSDISFAANPDRSCMLDQNRSLKNITNAQSTDKFIVNGHQLTLTGNLNFTNGAQIDATTALSEVVFAGAFAQTIPAGSFVSNTADAISLNNINGLTINGDFTVTRAFTLTSGAFTLGANTLTLNGSITTTAGTLSGGSSSNIIIGGSGATTILPAVVLNNLTLNRANGISLGGSVSVGGTLALTNGTLSLAANTLTISGNSPTRTNGNINAGNASATLSFTNASAIILPASIFSGSVNNLTINGSGGITASNDFTVNGVLNLQSPNPSSTKGSLAMGAYTLTLGANATTVGAGDVTGIVKRTSFTAGVSYTFGNQYNTMSFQNTGTLSTEMSIRVTIGAAPSWKPDAIQRIYEIIQTGASGALATTSLNYLDSELNGNTESNLVIWNWQPGYPVPIEHGVSNSNVTQNWVGSSNFSVEYLPSAFGTDFLTMANSQTILNTWNGSANTDWNNSINWTKGSVPLSTDDVIIPNTSALLHEPTMPASTTINSLTIQTGGVVNGGTGSVFTVAGAWTNNGTFNPGTSSVFFTNALATISGTTNFYNVTTNSGAGLTMELGSIMRIAGTLTNNGTLHATLNPNTIEYNGADQTVINPNSSIPGYYNLILSGSGTKILPSTELDIYGNITASGTITGTAAANMNILGNVVIGTGCVFNAGGFTFTIKGNITNNGNFLGSAGNTVILNGTASQSITGINAPNYYNLTVDNSAGVTFYKDLNIYNNLSLTNGTLTIIEGTLGINGTISQTSGVISINPLSSLSFGGTTAITVSGDLFASAPSINNLTINRTGGVTFGCDLTVNGVLNLQSANPSATKGALDMWDGSADKTLTMGASATTIGIGDVTGIITRNTIVNNVTYTFGSPFSSVIFPNVGTLPSSISVKVKIGTAPTWKSNAIQRVYDIIQTGASGTLAVIHTHYLDSELNGNDEAKIVNWIYIYPSSTLIEYGRSGSSITDNWTSISNVNFGVYSSSFGIIESSLAESELASLTWNGSVSTSWVTAQNWTPNGAPSDNTIVIIPDAATTPNDPVLPPSTACGTIRIENGGILNSGTGSVFTLNGASSVWSNAGGTYNAGNSTVIFTNPNATIDGTTDFYNLTLSSTAALSLSTGSVTRIAGVLTNDGILRAVFTSNTIEYNGTDQTIINPNGLTPGYYNLILSGSGTKTLPSEDLSIIGNFSMAGSATTTAASDLTITGNFTLGTGTTFTTGAGAINHTIGGNFTNNGTFNASVGDTITFNGSAGHIIDGSSPIDFYILDLDDVYVVTMATDITVESLIDMDAGNLFIADNTLGINGDIIIAGGALEVSTLSSLTFGGTSAITLNSANFTAPPSINNLTINRTGGVTFACDIQVNGILNLQIANPSASKGCLDMTNEANLTMGPSATTIGVGDVTGIIKRNSFVAGTQYTFGNQYTTITFNSGGTFPTELSVKVSIGTAPSWKTSAILRINDFIQTGANLCTATIADHYLDSELNGNTESLLNFWEYQSTGPRAGVMEWDKEDGDIINNWVSTSNMPIWTFPSQFGTSENTLANTDISKMTWTGSISTMWIEDGNWSTGIAPVSTSNVIIPDAATTPNDPTLPASAEIMTLTLNNGAILNSGTNSQFTLNGLGAWVNKGGTFNAGTSTVIFTNSDAFIHGTTSFNNIIIGSGASLTLAVGAITSIAGALVNNGSFLANTFANTVEFNGADQTIINSTDPAPGYGALFLSGSGIKTMPVSAMNITENLEISGTATAIANERFSLDGDFTIGASAEFTTGAFIDTLNGYFYNNGTFNATGSTIVFNSTGTYSIGGSSGTAFNNLTIESGTATISTAGSTVNGILLCNGTLNSDGNITLLSTAAQTALIDGSGAGEITGNVTIQRYLPVSFGYKYFSSPFQTATVNEFADEINLAASFPTFYKYDESKTSSGWVKYVTTTYPLNPMEGYTANFGTGTSPVTADATGVVNNGTMSVTLHNNNNAYTLGFNLVGNPYPSPINWNASSGWIKSNIDNALYYFSASTTDQYGGTYSSYIDGTSSDGNATNIIPSMQGFFIHVSNGAYPVTGVLGFSNDVRVTDLSHAFLKSSKTESPKPLLRLSAGYTDYPPLADPAVIYFDSKATEIFDSQKDALKLMNTDTQVPNFYSVLSDGTKLSINGLPLMTDSLYVIPMGVKTYINGTVVFKIKDTVNLSVVSGIYLTDNISGIETNLLKNKYSAYLTAGTYDTRFSIRFELSTTNAPEFQADDDEFFNAYGFNNILHVTIYHLNGSTGNLYMTNIAGRLIFIKTVYDEGYYDYPLNITNGIYIVTLRSGKMVRSKKIFISSHK